jgi:hypothetical protein
MRDWAAVTIERLIRQPLGRNMLAACLTAVALLHAARLAQSGIQLSADSHTYSSWADALVAVGFNPAAFLGQTEFVFSPVVYLLWVALIAVCKILFGASWTSAIVGLNWAAVVGIAAIILRVVQSKTGSGLATLLALGLFVLSFEILLFVPFVLSDILFLALATGVFLCGTELISRTDHGASTWRRWRVIGTLLVAAAVFFRPTAPPLLVFWGVAFVMSRRSRRWTTKPWAAGTTVAVLILAGILLHARFMAEPSRWPFRAGAGYVERLSQEFRTGSVVHHRPETAVAPPERYIDFVALTFRKWAYYFAPTVPGYGRVHVMMNVLLFWPAYGLAIAAIALWPDRRLTMLIVCYIVAFSLFHAIQKVDFDFRYRLPILPPLIVGAALGLSAIVTRVGASRDFSRFKSATIAASREP